MAYTRIAFPDFKQSDAEPHSYKLGTFDADAGQWFRVALNSMSCRCWPRGRTCRPAASTRGRDRLPMAPRILVGSGEVIGGPL